MPNRKFFVSLSLFLLLFFQISFLNKTIIPVTYLLDDPGNVDRIYRDRDLDSFILDMTESETTSLQGIYIEDKFQLPVTYQPAGNPSFVTSSAESVTFFSSAGNYGSIGLIAHNHLAGSEFFEINKYDEICLVYGDGRIEKFVVTEIQEYQALSPNSPYSSFINLSDPDTSISYRDLFFDTYGISDRLILQTCISKDNHDSWGRLFVIATPVSSTQTVSVIP